MTIIDLVRPSTLLRVLENGVGNTLVAVGHGAQYVGRKAVRVKRNIGIEMTARTLARVQRRLERETAQVATMSPAEIRQVCADQQQILARTAQLRRGRGG